MKARSQKQTLQCDDDLDNIFLCSGVESNRALRGPQIQVVGVALIIEFCDHNIPFLKVVR